MGIEIIYGWAWILCFLGAAIILVRMLFKRRWVEALSVLLASIIGYLTLVLPFGPHVWPALQTLAIIACIVSVASLFWRKRWVVGIVGVVLPLLAASGLFIPNHQFELINLTAGLSLMLTPLLFVFSIVFLTGAVLQRQAKGTV